MASSKTASARVVGDTAAADTTVVGATPSATADSYALRAGSPFTRTATQGVLGNDIDTTGAVLSVTGTTNPAHGTVTMAADGGFTYTPIAGYTGADLFTYTVSDGSLTTTGTVALTVVDDAPVAAADAYRMRPGQALVVSSENGLLANDTDANGDSLSVSGTSAPAHGTVVVSANGGFTYTPAAGFFGTDGFTYTVGDGTINTQGTATILVQDAAPMTVAHNYTVLENGTLNISAALGVLDNDIDPDGDKLTVTPFGGSNGKYSLAPDGSFTYTAPGTLSTDQISFYVSDGTQTVFATAKIYVNETGINGGYGSEAIASPDAYYGRPGQVVTRDASGGVLANDAQAEGLPFQLYNYTYSGTNSFVLQKDGSFVFTPTANFVGTDTATYTDFAGGGYFSATVNFVVVNTPPTATADSYAVHSGHALSLAAAQGVLANDTDVDGDPITVAGFTQPGHGVVAIGIDGSLTYTPNAGFMGTDSFTYTGTDGFASNLVPKPTKVTVSVADNAPVANNDGFTVQQGAALTRTQATGVLANDGDPDGDVITISGSTAPANGMLVLGSDGSFVYTPNAGFSGTDSFAYTITDGVLTSSATATIATAAVTACYAAGSGIATPAGRVAVEALRVGGSVDLHGGGTAPIIWLGHRRLSCRTHPRPDEVWPVRVGANAFGDGTPRRALMLSPDHAVYVDRMLIPIKHLINGGSIVQVPVDDIEYWHVELARHDVILAEGLPCESYLDTGNRTAFANGGKAVEMYPDFAAAAWEDACAELVQEGPRLAAVKRRLFARGHGQGRRPELALRVLADGIAVAAETLAPGVLRHAVPYGVRALRLVSPPWMPAACDAESLDRRTLGVRLLGAAVDGRVVPLDAPQMFSGFHPLEITAEGPCRWTDGDAHLVLPPGSSAIILRVGDGAHAAGGSVSCRRNSRRFG